jgi:hypothetical protein
MRTLYQQRVPPITGDPLERPQAAVTPTGTGSKGRPAAAPTKNFPASRPARKERKRGEGRREGKREERGEKEEERGKEREGGAKGRCGPQMEGLPGAGQRQVPYYTQLNTAGCRHPAG